MKRNRVLLTVLSVVLMLATSASALSLFTFADEDGEYVQGDNYVVAHWKFRNDPDCVSGNINNDDLTFRDLTGNGNDLVVASEGNGDGLDIFSWDIGVDPATLESTDRATSLKMDNSLAKAQSVDPYDPSLTSYSGAYVSGKYLQTVEGAPINNFSTPTGWTVEIIFKVSPEFNNNYNRYCGLFSRQGVVESQNEPAFSMALTEFDNGDADGSLGVNGRTGYQYLHVDVNENKTNHEMMNGTLAADTWHHYMVTSDGEITEIYIDGEYVKTCEEDNEIYITDPLFSWEVGVGRKLKGDKATMNDEYPQGLIRRLFCGSISEIRFSLDYMDVENSLLSTKLEAEEKQEKHTLTQNNVMDYWDEATFVNVFNGTGNQTVVSFTEEGLKLAYTGDENVVTPDPYYEFNILGYYRKVNNTVPESEKANFIAIKFKGEGLDGMFECFTARPAAGDSQVMVFDESDKQEDGWYYLIFDMTGTSLVIDNQLTTFRMDWAGNDVEPGAYCIINAIGIFETEAEAFAFCNIELPVEDPATEPEAGDATDAPAADTEAPAADATDAPAADGTGAPAADATDAPQADEGGCASVIGCVAVVLSAVAAAFVCRKH